MQTDYQILDIEPTHEIALIKEAYRKLVKQIHPDVAHSTFSAHLRFIEVNGAYRRLLAALSGSQGGKKQPAPKAAEKESGLREQKDPAYTFYKKGMNEFMKIHPSAWSRDIQRIMDKPGARDLKALKEIETRVRSLAERFPAAYYYFSIVVHEFPQSMWHYDAAEKMKQLEALTKRYEKIISSFLEHAKIFPKVNRMF